ncbi:hypothetical protein GKA01_25000 [Gluconobacter kanchanaburiensis NBRC 103587]|uniref:Uncharacterized protein n=1 Tax=Gluconobacter kanchanaburiensis NBRC 103587 TaxID=1307948 RepID=A0A511BCH9_9PROT|nr:hypothetical protein GKA01_25000 [Gluconobacter kanchanaburiensis NBRC 103587]
MGRRYRLTAGEGDLRESATENRPPAGLCPTRSFAGEHVAGKGETVRQERTASPATEMVTANPTGSKTE